MAVLKVQSFMMQRHEMLWQVYFAGGSHVSEDVHHQFIIGWVINMVYQSQLSDFVWNTLW